MQKLRAGVSVRMKRNWRVYENRGPKKITQKASAVGLDLKTRGLRFRRSGAEDFRGRMENQLLGVLGFRVLGF